MGSSILSCRSRGITVTGSFLLEGGVLLKNSRIIPHIFFANFAQLSEQLGWYIRFFVFALIHA